MFTHPDIEFRIAKQIQHDRHLAAAQRRLEAAARSARPSRPRRPHARRVPADATGPFAVLDPC